MNKTASSLFMMLFTIVILIGIMGYFEEKSHDHKTYYYEHPSSPNLSTTFTICGDTSLVAKDTGDHLDSIPKYFKE